MLHLNIKKTYGRLIVFILSFLFILSALVIILVNLKMKKYALKEAEDKYKIILDRNLATHQYFSHQLKPHLFEKFGAYMEKDYFNPSWMSSTYAIREIDNYFLKLNTNEYYYKEAAINARKPDNEANAYEREYLIKLNNGSNLAPESGIITENNKKYYYVLQKGEAMEQSCLRCHSTPENAPAGLIDYYDDKRSFDRSAGEVVSVISVKIPLSVAFSQANRFSLELSLVIIFIFIVLIIILFLINYKMIYLPEVHEFKINEDKLKSIVSVKELLIKETNHRVKNNLQIISSVLNLNLRRIHNKETANYLIDIKNKIDTISLIHEQLYNENKLNYINLQKFLLKLIEGLNVVYLHKNNNIKIITDILDTFITIKKALPVGLLVNEIVTNSIKYAFEKTIDPQIKIKLEKADTFFILTIKDNGSGINNNKKSENKEHFGMTLINAFVQQLNGKINWENQSGALVTITFPE